nr:ATP synthase F0 subunit 8 [Perittopus sp. HL-2012]
MPQMSPMSWMLLMFIFTTMLIMINTIMYFNKTYSIKNNIKSKTEKTINWKW